MAEIMVSTEFTGSGPCLVCRQGTDTGFAIKGDREWVFGTLDLLGAPRPDPTNFVHREMGLDPDSTPENMTIVIRVCQECCTRSGCPIAPKLLTVDTDGEAVLPCYAQAVSDHG